MPNTIMFPADFNTPVASALKDITKVQQRLFPQDQFFLSEYLLRGPISVPSGTVEYQVAKLDEGGYFDRGDVQDVEPDGVFPRVDGYSEVTSYGGTNEYGAEFRVTDAAVRRNRVNELTANLPRLRNHMVRDDARRLQAAFLKAAADHSRTTATETSATWDKENAFYEALTAALGEAGEGVDYDTIILNKRDAFRLAAVKDIRESTRYTDTQGTSPLYNSPLSRLDGLMGMNVVVHPNWTQGQALAVAKGQAGFVGEEMPLQLETIPDRVHQATIVRASKAAAPFIDVPQAFTLFTGIFG